MLPGEAPSRCLCVRVGVGALLLTGLPVVTLLRNIFIFFPLFISVASSVCGSTVVVKKTVHKRNRRSKACEPALHTHARQEAYRGELGTSEDPR